MRVEWVGNLGGNRDAVRRSEGVGAGKASAQHRTMVLERTVMFLE